MGFNSGFKGLIDNHLFVGSFLPSILLTTNPRHPATISPSLELNRTELIEIPYLSAGHYNPFLRHNWQLLDGFEFICIINIRHATSLFQYEQPLDGFYVICIIAIHHSVPFHIFCFLVLIFKVTEITLSRITVAPAAILGPRFSSPT